MVPQAKQRQVIAVFTVLLSILAGMHGTARAQSNSSPPGGQTLVAQLPVDSEGPRVSPTPESNVSGANEQWVSVIVKVDKAALETFETALRQQLPAAKITYRFHAILGGVAMLVPRDQIDRVATLPGVQSVHHDEAQPANTNLSPRFIHAPRLWKLEGGVKHAGEDVIVGIIDSGIWPEHPSFADPDPSGTPYPPPPAKWKGICEQPKDDSPPLPCNNKLIGVREFLTTFKAIVGLSPGEPDSARDVSGHGTHVASIAAGNHGVDATLFGMSQGQISGIAPRARLAIYRAGGGGESGQLFSSDVVAAIQQAILDGVDVINYSVSGRSNAYADPVSLAFLEAYTAGIFVAVSSSPDGDSPDRDTVSTIGHTAPWVTTVNATTLPRTFQSDVILMAATGDQVTLQGAALTRGLAEPAPVTLAAAVGDPFCEHATPDGTFTGQIVVCKRAPGITRTARSANVAARGAVGMLLINIPEFPSLLRITDTVAEPHAVPTVHLDTEAGAALLTFLATAARVSATITASVAVPGPGDVWFPVGGFAGPELGAVQLQTLGVSKPDLTAPGVNIIAAMTPAITPLRDINEQASDPLFAALTGTSMASPHVAGAAALLRHLYPSWTPGQIKSALMTTATTEHVLEPDEETLADPFFTGSGRLDPRKAGRPGLTFDVSTEEYRAHRADLWNVNYPSLYIPSMPATLTVQRTAHSEESHKTTWHLSVITPPDLRITVPPALTIPADGHVTFAIVIDASAVPVGAIRHATLRLQGPGSPHLPITIVRGSQ